MSLIFSRGCEYALQSMLYLASQPQNMPIFQRDISDALNIPPHFLGKVLQMLTRTRLVSSQKGKSGGFVLAKSPKNISLYNIIQAVDGSDFLDDCVLGFPGCDDALPCPVHIQWKQIKEDIIQMLKNKNIEQLGKEIDSKLNSIKQLNQNVVSKV